jgi:hypothetical protein
VDLICRRARVKGRRDSKVMTQDRGTVEVRLLRIGMLCNEGVEGSDSWTLGCCSRITIRIGEVWCVVVDLPCRAGPLGVGLGTGNPNTQNRCYGARPSVSAEGIW